jgi:hypothetical protein
VSDEDRLQINWVNSAGSALGAVSAAVVLSTMGTAGTLIGAAIGSLCITVGGAIYAHSLRKTRARLAAGRTVLVRGKGSTAADVAERDVEQSRADKWRQVLRELPWKRILVASAAVFAVAMSAILAFELVTGRPVSSYTGGTSDTDGGTSVPGVGGGGDSGADQPGGEELDEGPGEQQDVEQEESVPPPEEQGPAPVEEEPVEPAEEPAAPASPEETAP